MNVNMANDNDDQLGMNCAGGATIHFSLQGKGGVGKSVVASWLAQYFQSMDIPVICIDTDPVNATLSQFKDLHADHLNVLKAGRINEKQFDTLVERVCTHDGVYIVDTGATTFCSTLALHAGTAVVPVSGGAGTACVRPPGGHRRPSHGGYASRIQAGRRNRAGQQHHRMAQRILW